VLDTIGERETGTARLEEALAAYRAALEVRTREASPPDWAATQNNLGGVLQRLGEREMNVVRLKQARAALVNALDVDPDDENWKKNLKEIDDAIAEFGAH